MQDFKEYDPKTVIENSIQYFGGDELAATTWYNKYCLKRKLLSGEEIPLESSPADMHKRLARELARIESKYPNPMSEDLIYSLLENFKYIIPQGGSMSGIGNSLSIQSLSNCFVVGNKKGTDSYGGIFKIDEELVQLMKRRGGVGTDLSDLRPYGTKVTNAAKTSSGLVSFMERYSNSTREVAQEGRRGALMLSCSIKHPDSEKFIDAKVDTTKVTGANVSVKITNEFMKCVRDKKPYLQVYPIFSDYIPTSTEMESLKFDEIVEKEYKGRTIYLKKVDANKIWDKIIHNAWKSAEPGILFWDKILQESPADCYADYGFETVSTNPCGEIPLCPYDSCRLFAINLYSYVVNPFTPDAYFDYDKFMQHSMYAQRLMDDMVDLELEKIDEILEKIENDPEEDSVKRVERDLWTKVKAQTSKGRRTGLGVTAEGDMLAALNLTYASEEAIQTSIKVHRTLAISSYSESIMMGKERGCFEVWNKNLEKNNPFLNRVLAALPKSVKEIYYKTGRRNISTLTLAPTGTTSMMTQTTSGIEPAFLITYKRRRKTTEKEKSVFTDAKGDMFEEYSVFHHKFIDWYRFSKLSDENTKAPSFIEAQEILSKLDDKQLNDLIKMSPYYRSTSADIDWVAKVRMQGEVQKWIDHSISCTVNLPKEVDEELVSKVYMTAWEAGCKGVTIYRDGSRDGVLISTNKAKRKSKKRPECLDAKVIRFINGRDSWIAFIGTLDGKPYEIFTGKVDDDIKYLPKSIESGKIIRVVQEGGGRRYDFQYEIGYGYVNVLPNIGLAFNPEYFNYARLVSALLREGVDLVTIINTIDDLQCGDLINVWNKGVSRALRTFIADGTKSGQKCDRCGSELVYINGCTHCPGCGMGGKCD